jgi:hypothetical protein
LQNADSSKFVVPPLGGEWPETPRKTEEPPKGGTTNLSFAISSLESGLRRAEEVVADFLLDI